MRRIQIFPDDILFTRFQNKADELGISISKLVTDVLVKTEISDYGKTESDDSEVITFSEQYEKIKKAVQQFIDNNPASTEFVLSDIPEFMAIELTTKDAEGKQLLSSMRAAIGRAFNRQVAKYEIERVGRSTGANGKLKFRYKAAVYEIRR